MRSHSSDFLSQHHAWQAAAAAAWNYWWIKVAVSEMPRLAGEMGMLWQRLGLFVQEEGFLTASCGRRRLKLVGLKHRKGVREFGDVGRVHADGDLSGVERRGSVGAGAPESSW